MGGCSAGYFAVDATVFVGHPNIYAKAEDVPKGVPSELRRHPCRHESVRRAQLYVRLLEPEGIWWDAAVCLQCRAIIAGSSPQLDQAETLFLGHPLAV